MIYIGGDNGMDGALSAVNDSLVILGQIVMPTKIGLIPAKKKGNFSREVDTQKLVSWLESIYAMVPRHELKIAVTIEMPSGSKDSFAAKSMSGCYHSLRTLFELFGLPPLMIKAIDWQRDNKKLGTKGLLNCKPGDTKNAALLAVKGQWPACNLFATDRSRVGHDGIVDSLAINLWRIKNNI